MGCSASQNFSLPIAEKANGQDIKLGDNKSGLDQPIIPAIQSSNKIAQSVAFEVPSDDRVPKTRLFLPVLTSLSGADLKAKIAIGEANWNNDYRGSQKNAERLKRFSKKVEDPAAMKIRLDEKERVARENR